MSTSLFNRLYSYRQREGKNSKENFLIELLGYSLQAHECFRMRFIDLIGQIQSYEPDKFFVSTQIVYNEGRPDLELHINNNCHVLIECKVESGEGNGQLDNYRTILRKKNAKQSHLIYLTKYYEDKGNDVIHIRWYQVIDLLKNIDRSELLNELLKYLIEEGMETKEFDLNDLLIVQGVRNTISKMDEVLGRVESKFKKVLGGSCNYSSRSTKMQYSGWYGIYSERRDPYRVFILGFSHHAETKRPRLMVEFAIHKKFFNENSEGESLARNLDYEYWFIDDFHYMNRTLEMTVGLGSPTGSIDAYTKFFEEQLDYLDDISETWGEVLK